MNYGFDKRSFCFLCHIDFKSVSVSLTLSSDQNAAYSKMFFPGVLQLK